MPLKRYSKKEPQVFLWIMVPYIVFFNLILFGSCIFSSAWDFGGSFLCTGIYLFFLYFLFGQVAMLIKKRFSQAGEMFQRIGVMLPVFFALNVIGFSCLIFIYREWRLVPCVVKPGVHFWAIVFACLMSTIISFLNEGVANWEAWKSSLTETERLKNVYQRSQLLGLKAQLNPHFLFNCFNTLSGLIHEDASKAEVFLDEMTKVHRYILGSGDHMLISLGEEMKFVLSYLYLAGERFGESIKTAIRIRPDGYEKKIPPMSIQIILENIFHQNAMSKTDPIHIDIYTSDDRYLSVMNTLHLKNSPSESKRDESFDNLLKKYEILHGRPVLIQEEDGKRVLQLPLFEKNENNQ